MTDGIPLDGDMWQWTVNNTIKNMAKSGITFSAIGVGREADSTSVKIPLLEMATNGGGVFYPIPEVTWISDTVVQDVMQREVEYLKTRTNFKTIEIPNGTTSIAAYAFARYDKLKSIIIPASVTSIGKLAFYGCGDLESITVISGNSAYKADGNCLIRIADKALIAGCNASVIPDYVESIDEYTFSKCARLQSIEIPDNVKIIGIGAFAGCSELENFTIPFLGKTADGNARFSYFFGYADNSIPPSLKTIAVTGGSTIGDFAFSGCSGVTSITLPNSVTNIYQSAFTNCVGLKSIILPSGLTSIGFNAFYGCAELTDVYFRGTQSEWDAINKSSSSFPIETTIHYNYIGE
ncbi:MAG: leucine-rich repeat domain-containing protein [Firmicutes bacterium]|nr:leucine-rich repeat domain-containing protein [Bacillota bacterium]